jgi:hypothetical protein
MCATDIPGRRHENMFSTRTFSAHTGPAGAGTAGRPRTTLTEVAPGLQDVWDLRQDRADVVQPSLPCRFQQRRMQVPLGRGHGHGAREPGA